MAPDETIVEIKRVTFAVSKPASAPNFLDSPKKVDKVGFWRTASMVRRAAALTLLATSALPSAFVVDVGPTYAQIIE
jgi:hypothetical protein